MSCGFDTVDLFQRGASHVDRIRKVAKPAELPVQAPTTFELVVNLNTAKASGVTIPDTILSLADEKVMRSH